LEASTTKVSSKGQVVIPLSIRKRAGIREGERLLAIALGDTIVLKKIVDRTFEEAVKPIWIRIREIGLREEDVDAIIKEAKVQGRS
jgi:antitoxin PrlF